MLSSTAAFGGNEGWEASVSPAAPANAPAPAPLAIVPGTTVEIAVPPHELDEKDEIAALERIQYALSEVGDGKTYVWRRWHGRLSGIVQPTASFKDTGGKDRNAPVYLIVGTSSEVGKTTAGVAVLRSLRISKVKTPILILTGLAGIEDKVRGLGFGADDYMTKPFHKDELVARIHAIARRSRGHAQSVIQTGDLVVNLDTKTVEVNGARVHLTGKEYQMLELLSLRKGTTLTKEMFLNHLYGGMDEPEIKIIDVFMCKLRKKLAGAWNGKDYIETVWGRGYVLREPHADEAQIPA